MSESDSPEQQEAPEQADAGTTAIEANHPRTHWSACLKITLSLLAVWFIVSFGAAILLRDWCDANLPSIGNAPFGFWMAQQGSIIAFVLILIVYACLMNRLDRKHGYSEQ
jgi:putative solute:sodium symporter small subunit